MIAPQSTCYIASIKRLYTTSRPCQPELFCPSCLGGVSVSAMLRNLDTQEGMSLRPRDAKDMARNCCAKRSFDKWKKITNLNSIGNKNRVKLDENHDFNEVWSSGDSSSPPPKIEKLKALSRAPMLKKSPRTVSSAQSSLLGGLKYSVSRCLGTHGFQLSTRKR